jgi:hypothetical protein
MIRIISTLVFFAIAVLVTLNACSSGKAAFEKGNYYQAVLTSVNTLRRNPGQKKSAETLRAAYPLAVSYYEGLASNALTSNAQFKWTEVVNSYTTLNQMGDEIRRSPGALVVIPNPANYSSKLNEAKRNAAEEQYQAGIMALGMGARDKAKEAYQYFKRSNEFVANYKDANQKMQDALWAATVKVLVEPIPTQSRSMAVSTDFFNARLSEYLHQNKVNDFVKFYSPTETQQLKLNPDHIVRLEFDEFTVGNVYMSEKQIPLQRDSVVMTSYVTNNLVNQNTPVNQNNIVINPNTVVNNQNTSTQNTNNTTVVVTNPNSNQASTNQPTNTNTGANTNQNTNTNQTQLTQNTGTNNTNAVVTNPNTNQTSTNQTTSTNAGTNPNQPINTNQTQTTNTNNLNTVTNINQNTNTNPTTPVNQNTNTNQATNTNNTNQTTNTNVNQNTGSQTTNATNQNQANTNQSSTNQNSNTNNQPAEEIKIEPIPTNEQVTICHVPPGNAAARHTLTISRSALKAHLEHGDFEGSCDDPKNATKLKEVDKKAVDQKKNENKSNDKKGNGGGFVQNVYSPVLIASSSNDVAWHSIMEAEAAAMDTVKVYGTVKATLYYYAKTVTSRGVVNFSIIDAKTKAVLSVVKIPGEYIWRSEWGNFNGDERALTPQQLAITRNREQMPPSNQDMFRLFTEPIFQQVTQKIREFYKNY